MGTHYQAKQVKAQMSSLFLHNFAVIVALVTMQ